MVEAGSGRERSFLEHLDELRTRLLRVFIVVGFLTFFFFMFKIQKAEFSNNITYYYPYPAIFNSTAADLLRKIQQDLLPEGVRLIQTTPAEAITATLYVSIFLGILFGMPVIIHEVMGFVAPGLYPHEKKLIARLIVPSTILFISGCIFSYYALIPFIIFFLYRYGFALQVATFITIESFISFVTLFLVSFGLAFQLPIIMVTLSSLGVIEPKTWREYFRIAVFAFFVFGAVITPDGSGITMCIVAFPLIILYLLGYILSVKGFGFLPREEVKKSLS
ncbi:MAG: twin-arginine translocase subunit TatC [Candidatus Bathyarchaeota archaeon]